MPRVTIREVAAMAGVAVSTVSAVLNDTGDAKVASTTRSRVLEAVEILGYQPHHGARALRGKRFGCLVVIDDEISTGAYGGQMLAGVRDICDDAGIPVVNLSSGDDAARETDALRYARFLTDRPVIVATVSETVRTAPLPPNLVLLNGRTADDDIPGIVPDEGTGSALAVRELLSFGHRRIGFATIDPCEPADRRLHAAQQVLRDEVGPDAVPDELVVRMRHVEATATGGHEAGSRLLALPHPPTAVVCFNDRMAMGVYRAAGERGWRVPDDLSVIGFDNLEPVADSLAPGLTTVALPEVEMGQLAAAVALGIRESQPEAESIELPEAMEVGRSLFVPCPLVIRESVGTPRVLSSIAAEKDAGQR
jgi:LacI family transcriptional regulator